MTFFHGKYPSKGPRGGIGPWLDLIQETNGVRPGTFGAPIDAGDWWAGGQFELYQDARVIHHTDGSVSIVAFTMDVTEALREAEQKLRDPELQAYYDVRMGRVTVR